MDAANTNYLPRENIAVAEPTDAQLAWLRRGIGQPGGKLPLFNEEGQRVSARTVRSCLDHGWAEPWFWNAIKPDWLVCKLTDQGRKLINGGITQG
jgi:hypothetical protein